MQLIVPEGGVDAIAMKYKINDWSDYRPYLGHYCYVKAPTPLSVTHTLEQSSCAPVLYSPCMGKVRRVHKKWFLKRYRKALFHLGVSGFLASSLFYCLSGYSWLHFHSLPECSCLCSWLPFSLQSQSLVVVSLIWSLLPSDLDRCSLSCQVFWLYW